ncbi:MAG TPA: enoyl-CoA hydratase/isomerase family protein [Desulfomonilaceae bacterium]|nr:enoyl-CoA hydratase/isomerase family protein [Desulfomonilaceae bacterium]
MEIKYIKINTQEGIGRIQFNRPRKLNALNPDVLRDLETTPALCEGDESIRMVILTGDEKGFAAGTDIEHMSKGDIRTAYELTDQNMRVFQRLADLTKPTIAAVSGYALGGGCEAALCCDFRIVAENAVMDLPEITLGIIPGPAGPSACPV